MSNTNEKLIMLILLFLVGVLVGYTCNASTSQYDIDVDWPTSTTKESVLAITMNGCETRFIIENGNLVRFNQSTKDLDEVLKVAIKRYENGCK